MSLLRFDARNLDLQKMLNALHKQGYAIIENVLPSAHLSALHTDLEPYFNQQVESTGMFFTPKSKRIEALLNKSTVIQDMVINDIVFQAAQSVLGPNCDKILLNLTQGIRLLPGAPEQPLHPDSACYPISRKPFEFMFNAIWAYDEFTKENGATKLVPTSHNWPEGTAEREDEIEYAEMAAGSVLVYYGSLLHGGGANTTTEQIRTGISIGYCLGWLRQYENCSLTYSVEDVKHFSSTIQSLVGYDIHLPQIGRVNGHNPKALIDTMFKPGLGAEEFLTKQQTTFMTDYHNGNSNSLLFHNLS